jgi:hypothetical protein
MVDAGAEVSAQTANDWTPIHGAAKFAPPENTMCRNALCGWLLCGPETTYYDFQN